MQFSVILILHIAVTCIVAVPVVRIAPRQNEQCHMSLLVSAIWIHITPNLALRASGSLQLSMILVVNEKSSIPIHPSHGRSTRTLRGHHQAQLRVEGTWPSPTTQQTSLYFLARPWLAMFVRASMSSELLLFWTREYRRR